MLERARLEREASGAALLHAAGDAGSGEAGRRDLVVAYPTADRHAISRLAELAQADPDEAPVLMVDEAAHLDLIEDAVAGVQRRSGSRSTSTSATAPCAAAIQAGPKRSPIRTAEQARAFAQEIAARPGLELVGLMAYEGQIAGVGDDAPGKAPYATSGSGGCSGRRWPRSPSGGPRSSPRSPRSRSSSSSTAAAPAAIELTAAEWAVTELAAGSGFFAPVLFDHYSRFSLQPAAGFALPVVRRPAPGFATALGGGYLASGAAGADRLPVPYLPAGLHLDRYEGAGEVQTPLLGEAAERLRIGDRVYLRHAKAGELCERFDRLYLVAGRRDRRRGPDLPRRGARVPLSARVSGASCGAVRR